MGVYVVCVPHETTSAPAEVVSSDQQPYLCLTYIAPGGFTCLLSCSISTIMCMHACSLTALEGVDCTSLINHYVPADEINAGSERHYCVLCTTALT
jgi:hypothetical protein